MTTSDRNRKAIFRKKSLPLPPAQNIQIADRLLPTNLTARHLRKQTRAPALQQRHGRAVRCFIYHTRRHRGPSKLSGVTSRECDPGQLRSLDTIETPPWFPARENPVGSDAPDCPCVFAPSGSLRPRQPMGLVTPTVPTGGQPVSTAVIRITCCEDRDAVVTHCESAGQSNNCCISTTYTCTSPW